MPRLYTKQEPEIINYVIDEDSKANSLEIATTNQNKLNEFRRLLPNYKITGVKLDVDEIQSLNPHEVAVKKAKMAWEQNGFNPILVEDTSVDIAGLDGRPSTLATFFLSDPFMRKTICEQWLNNKDRRAVARVILAIYDGKEAHLFEGTVIGTIADSPRGSPDFGWDDIFIPDGSSKTFGEMTAQQKDKYSMRRRATKAFLKSRVNLITPILKLPEPFNSELERVNISKLENNNATEFAFLLEGINNSNPNKYCEATNYQPLVKTKNPYYLSHSLSNKSASIGLILTDVDRVSIKKYKNGKPVLWQMGPERRKLALAQRTQYFSKNINNEVLAELKRIEQNPTIIPHRKNRRDPAIETLLRGITTVSPTIYARAIKELGYKKISSNKEVSRSAIAQTGLFNKVGKYPRSVYGIGSMPAVSGWKDVITTAIVGHMPVFITRNSIFAGDPERRLALIKQIKSDVNKLELDRYTKKIILRNIGVALGTSNPKEELKEAAYYYEKAGVKLFRIYTINSDPRVIETAKLLRKHLGNDIEIFAGQIADAKQARKLVDDAQVDALVFGHGGGRQCTSAINGMAISTVEEIYSMIKDEYFNNTSLITEGGVGRSVGPLFILGVDAILYNQQLIRGTIEAGGIFLQNNRDQIIQPYHGSASAPTMIIEAANKKLHDIRINPSGRTKVTEGKPGVSIYSEKANSMTFWIDEFRHHAARTLADLGVENFIELREMLQKTDFDFLRIVSTEAANTASAYGNN